MENEKNRVASELPEGLKDKRRLEGDDTFCFGCNPGLPCFTDCCGDINIMLTPVDVLRLSRRLQITTEEFLDEHTLLPITKDLNLPVVLLRMGDDEKKKCPFVGDQGCTVYEDRPWSCRMYPVGMALPPARAGQDPEPIFFLFEDDFCKGHTEKSAWTVEKWRANQEVSDRENLDQGYQDLVGHPWFIGGQRHLHPKQIEMFHMACYDLDRFRRFVFSSTFLERFELEDELVEQLRDDDEELLRFSYRWLRYVLFGEPTITVRESASQPGRNP